LNRPTFLDHLGARYGVQAEGPITDFVSRRNGHLLFGDQIDLNGLIEHYGAPLEVAFCPLITKQIEQMQDWAATAREQSAYPAAFVYAYATKANFAEEVIRTALNAGAHHETSAAADVVIAHQLWQQGVLPADRFIFCNGSKDRPYLDAIIALRRAGAAVVPILDSVAELDQFLNARDLVWQFGVRARFAAELVDYSHVGGDRFGMTHQEIEQVIERLHGSAHEVILYHAMVGSQIEDAHAWEQRLHASVEAYCQLYAHAPALQLFNFGGGMPTSAYAIGFQFDYVGFLTRLMANTAAICATHGVPAPAIVGEFGRYTVASHSVFLMEVGAVKPGQNNAADWMLLNGSLMVSLPDILFVEGQEFVILPLNGWEREIVPAQLGGRYTCDTDDFYPRHGQDALLLPQAVLDEERYILAFFGVGAYQQMISGRGGAHHCLTPDMRRIIIEQDGDAMVVREVAPQSVATIMELLGYPSGEILEPAMPARPMVPVSRNSSAPADRRPIRESVLAARTPRRRQPTFTARVNISAQGTGYRNQGTGVAKR
jgi:arginine decarboxylase